MRSYDEAACTRDVDADFFVVPLFAVHLLRVDAVLPVEFLVDLVGVPFFAAAVFVVDVLAEPFLLVDDFLDVPAERFFDEPCFVPVVPDEFLAADVLLVPDDFVCPVEFFLVDADFFAPAAFFVAVDFLVLELPPPLAGVLLSVEDLLVDFDDVGDLLAEFCLRVAAARFAESDRDAALLLGDFFLPLPPGLSPPPLCLFTVAQARRSASSELTPFSS